MDVVLRLRILQHEIFQASDIRDILKAEKLRYERDVILNFLRSQRTKELCTIQRKMNNAEFYGSSNILKRGKTWI